MLNTIGHGIYTNLIHHFQVFEFNQTVEKTLIIWLAFHVKSMHVRINSYNTKSSSKKDLNRENKKIEKNKQKGSSTKWLICMQRWPGNPTKSMLCPNFNTTVRLNIRIYISGGRSPSWPNPHLEYTIFLCLFESWSLSQFACFEPLYLQNHGKSCMESWTGFIYINCKGEEEAKS